MKINCQTLKRLRADKLWSQEQLAQASGLSLRTIQRIESSGNASMESVAALAAALATDKATLQQSEPEFTPYRHQQLGYFMWVIAASVLSLLLAIPHPPLGAVVVLVLCAAIFGVLFFSLSIRVSAEYIDWYFGPRFWRKQLAIADVASCEVVRNSPLSGWGIRMLGDGWLYNVSGLLAVEIRLKSGAVIRLGSDQPNYLKAAIDGALVQSAQQALNQPSSG